jgi:hypothetical protein
MNITVTAAAADRAEQKPQEFFVCSAFIRDLTALTEMACSTSSSLD